MSSNIFVRRIGVQSEARIREWIKALVSGKFQQANGSLKKETGGYCCLGVICQLADPEGWGYEGERFGHVLGDAEGSARNGYLSASAASSYNLSTAGQKKLVKLNDSGASFGEIAVFIAEQLGAKLAAQA